MCACMCVYMHILVYVHPCLQIDGGNYDIRVNTPHAPAALLKVTCRDSSRAANSATGGEQDWIMGKGPPLCGRLC